MTTNNNIIQQRAQEKFNLVMQEFDYGTLHSGSGQKVTDRKQALAIAFSESGLARKKTPKTPKQRIIGKLEK